MVSFSCAVCGDVVKKPKVASHATQCRTQRFSCVDCMKDFDLTTIANHTSCVSEKEKYQGKWDPSKAKIPSNISSQVIKPIGRSVMMRPKRPALSYSSSSEDDEDPEKNKKTQSNNDDKTGTEKNSSHEKEEGQQAKKQQQQLVDSCSITTSAEVNGELVSEPTRKKRAVEININHHNAAQDSLGSIKTPTSTAAEVVLACNLGTSQQLREVIQSVQEAYGASCDTNLREVARYVVQSYEKRLVRAMMHAISNNNTLAEEK